MTFDYLYAHLPFLKFLIIFLCAILFLLVIRELNTWYWKINKAISLLEEIAENTSKEEEEEEDAIETPLEVKEK